MFPETNASFTEHALSRQGVCKAVINGIEVGTSSLKTKRKRCVYRVNEHIKVRTEKKKGDRGKRISSNNGQENERKNAS